MLAIKSIGSGGHAGHAASYYEGYQSGSEEPDKRRTDEPNGTWIDSTERSGIKPGDVVRSGELRSALEGFDPADPSKKLSSNAGADNHKPGWDLTFSAPKSVSAVWAAAGDEQRREISGAQQKAVETAIAYAKSEGVIHERRDGANHAPKNVMAASFEHASSRSGDPHLHTHVLVSNANERSLDFDASRTHELGAVYRSAFANELQRQGYRLEADGDGRTFRLADFSRELERDLSTRNQEINERSASTGLTDQASRDQIRLATRDSKTESPREEAFARAKKMDTETGLDVSKLKEGKPIEQKNLNLDDFLQHAFSDKSTLNDHQLARKANEFVAVHGGGPDRAKDLVTYAKAAGELVHLHDEKKNETVYTSQEIARRESQNSSFAREQAGSATTAKSDVTTLETQIKSKGLSGQQESAVRHVTDNKSNFAVVEGAAGTGKSYMLGVAREAWEAAGSNVKGVALAGKAAAELERGSGIKSQTIESFSRDIQSGREKLNSKSVVVIDEAGMVDSKSMGKVVDAVKAAGAKLVLVGDTQQLQAVGAGAAMRSMKESAGSSAAIDKQSEIRRHDHQDDRAASVALRSGDGKGAHELLAGRGYMREHRTSKDANEAIAKNVVKDMQEGKTSGAISASQKAVNELNSAIRSEAKNEGLVSDKESTYRAKDKNTGLTRQKQFAVGDRVITLENNSKIDVKNGQTWTVKSAKDGQMTIERDGDKKQVTLDDRKYQAVDHGYAVTTYKAQGMTVDRMHVMHDSASDRQGIYVATTRHRESMTYNYTSEQNRTKVGADGRACGVKEQFSRSAKKTASTDFDVHRATDALISKAKGELAQSLDSRAKADPARDVIQEMAKAAGITRGGADEQQPGQIDAASKKEKAIEALGTKASERTWLQSPNAADWRKSNPQSAKQDAYLASRALGTKGTLDWQQAGKDIKSGKASLQHDRRGNSYVHYKDGRVFSQKLHSKSNSTQLMTTKNFSMRKDAVVVKGRFFGTTVLVGRQSNGQAVAGAISKAINCSRPTSTAGKIAKAVAKHTVGRIAQKNEGWRKATFLESMRARVSIAVENSRLETEARRELKEIVADAKNGVTRSEKTERKGLDAEKIAQANRDARWAAAEARHDNREPRKSTAEIEKSMQEKRDARWAAANERGKAPQKGGYSM